MNLRILAIPGKGGVSPVVSSPHGKKPLLECFKTYFLLMVVKESVKLILVACKVNQWC